MLRRKPSNPPPPIEPWPVTSELRGGSTEDRVLALEIEYRHMRDRIVAMELAKRYEAAVPKAKPFPWGTIVLVLLYIAYGIVNYLLNT